MSGRLGSGAPGDPGAAQERQQPHHVRRGVPQPPGGRPRHGAAGTPAGHRHPVQGAPHIPGKKATKTVEIIIIFLSLKENLECR